MWIDVDQRSVEWLKMRTGCVTASRIFDIVDRLKKNTSNGQKGGYKQTRHNYMVEIACEHLTGRASEHYVSEWTLRGQDDEMLAIAAYQDQTDELVEHGGYALHDTIKFFGASPDSRVGEKGLLEIKNLKPENHLETIQAGSIPNEFVWQMNAQLACMPEREWVDYGSYCKEMQSPGLRLFLRRHYRDKERIAEVENEVLAFQAELAEMMQALAACKPILAPSVGGLAEVL
jgi:YqaJ-like viral recombinase domain